MLNWWSGPGSPGNTCQNALSAGLDAYAKSNSSCAVPSPWVSDHIHSTYLAKPSLSQMLRQDATDTESPNHWWAFSCTMTYGFEPRRKNPPSYTGRVWVSSANPRTLAGTTTPPRASNGYGP